MDIKFYRNASDNNVAHKKLIYVNEVKGSNRQDITELSCTVDVVSTSGIKSSNYCFIEEFHRYYYITDKTHIGNGLLRLNLKVDVLMTYINQIMNERCVIQKQENEYNLLYNDGSLKMRSDDVIYQKKFPEGFTQYSNILVVAGPPKS